MKILLLSFIWLCSFFSAAYAQESTETVANVQNVFQLSYGDAEEAVAAALHQKGIDDKLLVTMNGRKDQAIYSYDKPVTVVIKGLQVEKIDHHWSASMLFVANGEVISAIPAAGHFDEIAELPVLKRAIRAGDIISENDIEVRDFSQTHTRTDTVTDMSALIGKSPTHNLSPARPIREHEIANPTVMKKNAIVEMRYSSPGMEISTTGEAMNDGARGDIINVRNSASKKIVRGVIADNKTVTIIAPGTQTSQLSGNDYVKN